MSAPDAGVRRRRQQNAGRRSAASRSAADRPATLAICARIGLASCRDDQQEPARTEPGEPYGIVAIAASAGGIVALGHVLGGLPSGFPVPVVVVQHLGPRHKTIVADVLGRRAQLLVVLAQGGDLAEAGTI
jgi:chemotaxis response regulator CheB